MGHKSSLSCLEVPATCPYPEPEKSNPHTSSYFLKIHSILSSHMRLGLPSALLPSMFPSSVHSRSQAQTNLLDVITKYAPIPHPSVFLFLQICWQFFTWNCRVMTKNVTTDVPKHVTVCTTLARIWCALCSGRLSVRGKRLNHPATCPTPPPRLLVLSSRITASRLIIMGEQDPKNSLPPLRGQKQLGSGIDTVQHISSSRSCLSFKWRYYMHLSLRVCNCLQFTCTLARCQKCCGNFNRCRSKEGTTKHNNLSKINGV